MTSTPLSHEASHAQAEKQWVQLAGHEGSFVSGADGRVLKRFCQTEADCLRKLANDPLCEFTPKFYGVVAPDDGEKKFVEMQDLLHGLTCPSLMDCKIGCRTYLESELGNDVPRSDLYAKMLEVEPAAPTAEERAAGAVTKSRYMAWRERLSSTASLAFRVDGVRKAGAATPRDLKTLRSEEDVAEIFAFFADGSARVLLALRSRLELLRLATQQSEFFRTHELIGSSLLFAYDSTGFASVWMIDFGKTAPSPTPITHCRQWQPGNHEDGYCIGVDNILRILALAADKCA